MSVGLALYGLSQVSVENALDTTKLLFESMGYDITDAGYLKFSIVDRVKDIVFEEVKEDVLLERIRSGEASDFRIYSDANAEEGWSASAGFSSEKFGSFYCIDFECTGIVSELGEKLKNVVYEINSKIDFSYGIVYELGRSIDAMWYARGQNLKTIYECESSVAFSRYALRKIDEEDFYSSKKLRMVYPINFLNDEHALIIIQGLPLLDWISASAERGKVVRAGRFWCWEVERDKLEVLNEVLGRESALLAWQLPRKKIKPKLP